MDVLFQSGAGYEARTRFPASHELPAAIRRNPASPLIGCALRARVEAARSLHLTKKQDIQIGCPVSVCLVLTEKMRSGKCTTVQSVESSIMTTKPLTKSTSCCGSRSCGLYKIRPQRKGRQTCRFFLCDLKIMNLFTEPKRALYRLWQPTPD